MTHRKLIEQMLLDALKDLEMLWYRTRESGALPMQLVKSRAAITAAREYLAQPEQSEPVGEITETNSTGFKCEFNRSLPVGAKLYTAAPQPTTPEPVNQMLLAACQFSKSVLGKMHPDSDGVHAFVMLQDAIAAAEQAPQPTELTDEEIEELTWNLGAEKIYEQYTGQESVAPTGVIEFARAVLAAQKAKT